MVESGMQGGAAHAVHAKGWEPRWITPPAASGIGVTFSHYHVSKAILYEEVCMLFELSGQTEQFRVR
jgi:hypothetical protein